MWQTASFWYFHYAKTAMHGPDSFLSIHMRKTFRGMFAYLRWDMYEVFLSCFEYIYLRFPSGHTSSCPPCKALIKVPCRCGLTVRQIRCHEQQKEESERQDPFLCDKVCGALRLCGRHQCSRICCPLGSISRNKPNKSKKKGPSQRSDDHWEDSERIWHTCDLVCGKLLSCGLHRYLRTLHRWNC